MAVKRLYYVTTYDPESGEFTPQHGVWHGPYTQFGLRKALRRLRDMGYDVSRRGGFGVMVERFDKRADALTDISEAYP